MSSELPALKSKLFYLLSGINESFDDHKKQQFINFTEKYFHSTEISNVLKIIESEKHFRHDWLPITENSLNSWVFLIKENLVVFAAQLYDYLNFSDLSGQKRLLLALLSKDELKADKLLKSVCLRLKIEPNFFIQKLFHKKISLEILEALPKKYAIFLSKNNFYQNCFEPECDLELVWLSKAAKVPVESALAHYFIHGQINSPGENFAQVLNFWREQRFSEILPLLELTLKQISRNKVSKSRFCEYWAFIHLFCLNRVGDKKKLLEAGQIYKNFLGESLISKVLEIFIDTVNENYKSATKKLSSLHHYHKHFYADKFFVLLVRFWCEGSLTANEIERLKNLLENYMTSQNKLLVYEIGSLYKEAIGAGNLLENYGNFSHIPLARFLKNEVSIFTLLEQKLVEQAAENRFIWLLQLEPSSNKNSAWVDIEPAIQEKGKSGIWKEPKLLSWQEMTTNEIHQMLNNEDKKVVSLLKDGGFKDELKYKLPENLAIKHLIGAENLYLSEDIMQKISLIKINPVIEFSEDSGVKKIIWKSPNFSGDLYLNEIDEFVYEVCVLDEKLLTLKEKCLTPLTLNNSLEELRTFFAALPNDLIVEGDVLFDNNLSKITDCQFVARVTHLKNENYKIQLLVTAEGLTAVPGSGKSIISIRQGKLFLNWQRDKERERRLAENYRKCSGLNDEDEVALFDWEVPKGETLFAALSFFHETPEIKLEWLRGKKFTVQKTKAVNLVISSSSKKNWFDLRGEIQIDKKSYRISEILKALQKDNRFIKITENEFIELTEELHKGLQEIALLTDQKEDELSLYVALADTLSGRLAGLPISVEEDFIFREAVTQMIYAKSLKVSLPEEIKVKLREYQIVGFEWMTRLLTRGVGICLADDMGLGKTLQTLAVLTHQKEFGTSLVIAPTSLCNNWLNEAKKFVPAMTFIDYRGSERSLLLKKLKGDEVLVTSYGLLLQDIDLLKYLNWNLVVLDEAQMVKNAGAMRSKSIKLLTCRGRLALTGTPMENHVGELWNLFDWLNPGLLGTNNYFHQHYALPIEKNISGVLDSLRQKIQPFILRRLKNQVLQELPDSQEILVSVDLNAEEEALYKANKYLIIKKLNLTKKEKKEFQNKVEILAEITRLRKFAANFEMADLYEGVSSKTEAVLQKVEELLENNHKALLFSQFTTHLDVIENYFQEKGYSYSRLDGSMNPEERNKNVEKFMKGEVSLMLISLKAGGFGLNLTEADFVLHLDPWWNPAIEQQASARAIRMGQKNKVTVLRFITNNTIEAEMVKLHEHKKYIADDLLKGSATASKLSVDDLLKLLK